jgi:hypothetical protein
MLIKIATGSVAKGEVRTFNVPSSFNTKPMSIRKLRLNPTDKTIVSVR